MRVVALAWTPFRLPLREPFLAAGGSLSYREGLLLRLTTDAGVVGLGEASPHPALGPRALREVRRSLEGLAPALLGVPVTGLETLPAGVPPALACALDTAACDALARAEGVNLARFLGGEARLSVAVNAVIGAATAAEAVQGAAAAREAGFPCVKLKVGTAPSAAAEVERVAAVRSALGPHVALRLDANGAWSADEAIRIIRALARFDLELVEQPVPAEDRHGMVRVRAAVEVPIAADEAVTDVEAARRLLAERAADLLIVKPMVVGGVRPARRIIEAAAEAGAEAIVTTTLDSAVGTAAALHLAATLPAPGRACGLATGRLLAGDLVRDPPQARLGRMDVPGGPGLGVEVDEALLARFAIGERRKA